jgi:outer membrane receptor protein involved in Fe transport
MIDITDSLNQHGGNPYLKPELVNAFEVGYNKEGEGWSLSSSAFYRLSNNIIRSYIDLKPNGVAITTPQNFGNATTYGVEEILDWFPTKFWSVNTSLSLFDQKIDGNVVSTDVANEVVSWYGKMIHNFTLSKQSKLQIIGAYNAPTAMAQGTRMAVYNVDLGFQTKILKGKGGIGIVISDVFNMQSSGWDLSAANFALNRKMKVDTRAVFVTFAYSFANIFKESLLDNLFSNN